MQLFTTILVAINVLIFLFMYKENPAALWQPPIDLLLASGADYGPLTAQTQWWRILTCGFVHVGAAHLVVNMLALMNLGSMLERGIGVLKYLIIYFISMIAASLLSLYFHPHIVSAGASGALFGLMGCQLIYMLSFWRQIPKGQLISGLLSDLIWIGLLISVGYFFPQIDNYAHLGGFIGGITVSLILLPLNEKSKMPKLLNIAGLVVFGLVLSRLYALVAGVARDNPEVQTASETAQVKAILHSNKLPFWLPNRLGTPAETLGAAILQCPDSKTAIDLANKEVQLDPGNAYSYYNRALVQHKFGNDSETLVDVEKAITLAPSEYNFLILLARAEVSLNQYDKALESAQSCLKIERKSHADAKDIIGCCRLAQGNVKEAIVWFDRAIAEDEQLGAAYYHRAIAHSLRHDTLKAKQDFIRAQARNYLPTKWDQEHVSMPGLTNKGQAR